MRISMWMGAAIKRKMRIFYGEFLNDVEIE
jgi:hypothetical protein